MALEVQNLKKTYRYHGKPVVAVADVSLSIKSGEILAFLGANGAGKTTTVKMIAGLIFPDSGWVKIAGLNPHHNPKALKKLGTVLEGNRNLYWRLTAEENLIYFGVLKGLSHQAARKFSLQLLKRFGLFSRRSALVQNLSRGMQQKLAIATSLIHQPSLLLLDEPTLGLDVEAVEDVKLLVRQLAEEGLAILLTTHQLNVAEEISDRVAIINNGKISTIKPTRELIKEFSGTSYTIEIEGVLDPDRIKSLKDLGAIIIENRLIQIKSSDQLYQAFEILNPLFITRLETDQVDLTDIFFKFLKE
ncbi:MAG: ABC transporter ATP-binding protein [Cyanobacteria bacterium J06621_8]